ncbi:hypothetical protein PAMC26510_09915 [Caballeronia sordidicola]|uniref:Uncharacterized protein n=1 Tax=Caballeronia sordidicola TaxID=196367 RepID=A0A242MZ47_CABSO|nr:hypothetical protein PAMC26510_09915 [Caballeronia sordidicola]
MQCSTPACAAYNTVPHGSRAVVQQSAVSSQPRLSGRSIGTGILFEL